MNIEELDGIRDRLDRIIDLLENLAEFEYLPSGTKAEAAQRRWDALPLDERYRRSVEVLRGPTLAPQPVDPDRPAGR